MNAFFALYCFACLGLVYGVYHSAALDFRGVGRLSRRPAGRVDATEEDDFADPREAAGEARSLARELRRLARFEVAPRADFHLLLMLGGLLALAAGASIGLLTPLALETMFGVASSRSEAAPGGATDLAALSYAADQPMARLAQVVGAASGAAIALRMLRIFMGLGALCSAVLLFLMAVNFVIGRPILALFGV